MAPLSSQDREWIKAVSHEVALQAMAEILDTHIQSCPHGQMLGRMRALGIGVAIGLMLAGAGVGFGVARLLPWAL